jgi:hypothetical protein
MSCKHHTSSSKAVPLDLPAAQVAMLRETFSACLDGIRDDFAHGRRFLDPDRARRNAGVYERILAGLDRGEVFVPDDEAREAVRTIATVVDADNEYTTVVAEHAALYGLLACLGDEVR